MYIVFKTDQGNIRVSGTFLITGLILTFILLATMIRAADYASSSVIMNATVSNTVAVNISAAVQRGILFGSPAANTNYNMAQNDSTGTGNVTQYWIGNDPSSTGTLILWHYAADMTRGGVATDKILIGNVTNFANQTSNGANVNMTTATPASAVTLTTSWAKVGGAVTTPCDSLATGTVCYTAYWLNVPANTVTGTYNTTYYYCGNLSVSSTACS